MNRELLSQIRTIKEELAQEGFVIDAVIGSFARGEERSDSDLDLLYHLEEPFLKRYGGFIAFKRIAQFKNELQQRLGKEIDLIPGNHLSETGKRYILSHRIDV